MRKRFASIVLTAALAVSMLATPAFAAEDQTVSELSEVESDEAGESSGEEDPLTDEMYEDAENSEETPEFSDETVEEPFDSSDLIDEEISDDFIEESSELTEDTLVESAADEEITEESEEDAGISLLAVTTVASGSCGSNVTWVYTSDGTLTLSGSGETEYYASSNPPWYSYRNEIKKIVVSSGITSLGTDLFWNCSAVTSVSLPSSLTVINTMAFAYCTSLTSITIPDKVTKVGSAAFVGCTSLKSVTIGAKVEDLDTEAFADCTSLAAFTVASGNSYFSTSDGVLFNKKKTKLVTYPDGKTSTSYTVPSTVTTIGEWAFSAQPYLKKITIPGSVKTIEQYAFYNSKALTSVTFNSGLETIEAYAFAYCTGLTSVSIPSSVITVAGTAFDGCSNLTINYPSSLTKMEDGTYKLVDTVKVSGTYNYDYAYQVLDLVNQERKAEGRSALTMDKELLDAAMQRAAECSIYYSHTRPSGISSSSISTKLAGENIAYGQGSPSAVMNAWMNSSGHKTNILMSSYKSIGVGCFEKDGILYWVQIFSRDDATAVSKSGSTSTKVSVAIDPDTVGEFWLLGSTSSLNVGSSTTLTARIGSTKIENSSLKWSSSDKSIATVNSSGKVTAVGNGKVKITAKTNGGNFSDTYTIVCGSGELKKASDGNWYYYLDGERDSSYTGFATNSNGKWYVEKGKVTKKTNGVFKDKTGAIGTAGNWYYVINSKVQTSFTGLSHYKNSSGWWYITKGKVDRSYTGLAKNQNGWFYVKKGKVDRSYTGFAKNSSGKWYVSGGKVTKTKNGVFKDKTGAIGTKNAWYYVVGSKVQTKYTGLANYSNSSGWWYITNGKVDRSYNGLAKNKNGWFYIKNGKVDRSYTGTAKNSSGTWYVKNGKVQKSFTGTVTIGGKKYSVTNGKVKA